MAQLYFHCSNSQTMLVDQRGTTVRDLIEARDHAASVVWSLAMLRGPQDWRDWSCMSATISTKRFLPCPLLPSSASRIERPRCSPRNRHSSRCYAAST